MNAENNLWMWNWLTGKLKSKAVMKAFFVDMFSRRSTSNKEEEYGDISVFLKKKVYSYVKLSM